jgi:hypothetical protein
MKGHGREWGHPLKVLLSSLLLAHFFISSKPKGKRKFIGFILSEKKETRR